MFHDAGRFGFAPDFERDWRAIRDEYRAIRGELMDWSERELYGEGWQVFGLFDFPGGREIEPNARRCPVTSGLAKRLGPGLGAVGFSVLHPGTTIRPHRGFPGRFLRFHLGLEVPEGDCALRVGGETRRWEEGRALVFDDRELHDAWNRTGRERAILLVDFVPADA